MKASDLVLGIDTSNYTTSVAIADLSGNSIANIKRPLPVKQGERGLRQSDAVFAHIKNLPSAMQEAKAVLNGRVPIAIGVSARPRNLDTSYMPCFLSGVAAAESISAATAAPIYTFSHQCGHIMAAIFSSGNQALLDGREFCAFHVSGGTTEVLKVKFNGSEFITECVGGTMDLSAGQVIDRIGVHMGMSFPSGREMEKFAITNKKPLPKKKMSVNDTYVNLSGLENMAIKLYSETVDIPYVSAFVLNYIADALITLAENYKKKYNTEDFLFAGGVMSNEIIKSKIKQKINAYFALPEYSSDNALGIALLCARKFKK